MIRHPTVNRASPTDCGVRFFLGIVEESSRNAWQESVCCSPLADIAAPREWGQINLAFQGPIDAGRLIRGVGERPMRRKALRPLTLARHRGFGIWAAATAQHGRAANDQPER